MYILLQVNILVNQIQTEMSSKYNSNNFEYL